MKIFWVRRHLYLLIAILGLAACGPDSPEVIIETATAVIDLPAETTESPTPEPNLLSSPTAALAATETATATSTPILATNTPQPIPESIIEVEGAIVPPGFSFIKFAEIYRPTSLTFDDKGRLFVTSVNGTVRIFHDEDGDGRSDTDSLFAADFNTPLGITLRPGTQDVYVASNGHITLLRDENNDGRAEFSQTFVSNIPTGLHQNDNLKFGSDGWLYMGVGSTCDACFEDDPQSATIMRFNVDSGESEIIATGLRNPFDIAFHPTTGDLFATDNGRDDLGLDSPFEELNHIVVGGDYGWPNCWNVQEGSGCAGTETAVAFFEPHASANGIDFYAAASPFPAEYQDNAFVTIFGTFLTDGVGTGIARVELSPDGASYQGNVSWFAQWPDGRPLPIIVGPDGAIYVGDYINSVIYRISYGP